MLRAFLRGCLRRQQARWVCRVGGHLGRRCFSRRPFAVESAEGSRSTGRLAVPWRTEFQGCLIGRGRTGEVFFQYTTKGIKKEIATGVRKPDTYRPVANAENQPLRRTGEWQYMMPAPLVAPPNCTAESRGTRFATLGRRVPSVARRVSKRRVFGPVVGRKGCSRQPSLNAVRPGGIYRPEIGFRATAGPRYESAK